MPQFGASLTDNSKGVIYDCNVFIIQATVITLVNYNRSTFIVKALVSNVIISFSLSLTAGQNKLDCFCLEGFLKVNLTLKQGW